MSLASSDTNSSRQYQIELNNYHDILLFNQIKEAYESKFQQYFKGKKNPLIEYWSPASFDINNISMYKLNGENSIPFIYMGLMVVIFDYLKQYYGMNSMNGYDSMGGKKNKHKRKGKSLHKKTLKKIKGGALGSNNTPSTINDLIYNYFTIYQILKVIFSQWKDINNIWQSFINQQQYGSIPDMNEFNNLVQQTEQLIISNYSQNQNYGNPANTMRNPNNTASLFGSNDIPPIQSSSSFGSSSYPLSRGSSFSSSSDSLYPLSRSSSSSLDSSSYPLSRSSSFTDPLNTRSSSLGLGNTNTGLRRRRGFNYSEGGKLKTKKSKKPKKSKKSKKSKKNKKSKKVKNGKK
tara:strand:- start:30 stop:1073 length:1044 start_codon:yes stop_codon:yes gene_type:complete